MKRLCMKSRAMAADGFQPRWSTAQSVIRMMVISYLTAHRHLEDLMIALTEAAKKHADASCQEPGRQAMNLRLSRRLRVILQEEANAVPAL